MRRLLFWLTLIFLCCRTVSAAAPFELHVLDVGQGQCVLVEADRHYMLIDGGGRDSSSFVVRFLKQQGISEFDYIAVSHFDEDHLAGTIGVLSVFRDDLLLLPSYTGEGMLYDSFLAAMISNGCDVCHPQAGDSFQLGGAEIRIVGPASDYPVENDRCLAIRISYGDTSYLICGDAEQQSELDMAGQDIGADLYVVNHHGSSTSTMDAFLDAVDPEYAVISCGTGNSYGHPHMETMQRLKERDIQMFRTDKQRTVSAYSDGEDIWFNTYPCDDWSSGNSIDSSENANTYEPAADPSEISLEESVDKEAAYVCNTNTKKFHYPDCNSVNKMKEEHKLFTNLSRDALIMEGYEPCGNCNP